MKRKTISMIAVGVLTTFALTACTGARVVTQGKPSEDKMVESSYTESVVENKLISMEPEFTSLLSEYYDSGKELQEVLSTADKSSALYSSGLYVKLREFGLDDETIMKELHNVVTFGLVHPSADGWKNDLLVENLNKSLNYSTDAIVYYYPLAAYVHLFNCKDEHEVIDGRIKCDKIYNDLMDMNENILFANYIVENIMAMDDEAPIKIALQRIINSDQDTETCIYELENIYRLGMIPRCASEEEWATIAHLDATTGEMENPFEVYYDLAIFVHTLKCQEEHYVNEFGQWECESIRKEMESGLGLGK